MQEIRRRRHRKKKVAKFEQKVKTASASDKATIAEKLRRMTPGAEEICARLKLEDR